MENVLIVDDDISQIVDIRLHLKSEDFNIDWIQDIDTATAALKNDSPPDLVILDLFFNGKERGFDLVEICEERSLPYVVMTGFNTSYLFDRMVGYKPLGYYTKPIDYTSLVYLMSKISSAKIEKRISAKSKGIYVRKRSSLKKVIFHDIIYMHAEGNYVTLYTVTDKFVVRKSLSRIEKDLPEGLFIKIHRNYVIQKSKVKSFDRKKSLLLVGQTLLPIGRSYLKSLKHLVAESK